MKLVVFAGKLTAMPVERLVMLVAKLVVWTEKPAVKLVGSVEKLVVRLAGSGLKPAGNRLEVPGLHFEFGALEQL